MFKKRIVWIFVAVFLMQSVPAFAIHEWKWDSRSHRPRYGTVVRWLPSGHHEVRVRNRSYYYHHGLFYRRSPRGYVLIPAPVGARVRSLPLYCRPIVVAQTPYYIYEDTYYTATSDGNFVVTAAPSTQEAQPTSNNVNHAVTNQDPEDKMETYDIYIPNPNGSYTVVTLKKYEKGFIGPQGEFYPEYPSIEQLKMMYAKH